MGRQWHEEGHAEGHEEQEENGNGEANLLPLANWDGAGQPTRSAAELVAGLEITWRMIARTLARQTVADLAQVFLPPATLTEAERAFFGPSRGKRA